MEYHQTSLHEKIIPYEKPCKFWEMVGGYIFTIKNSTLLYNIDYYSIFPFVKKDI